ncbi:MAG TPA: anti-sigma regulatory factor [Jatrophihabitantaceae bacterium]|jgi:serine/threonine-protein kinase RsbT
MTELDMVIAIDTADDIVTARQAGRELATKLEFSLTDVTMITTAISEVARNISKYAGRGRIRLGVTQRNGRRAMLVQALDDGPGIADIEQALEDGFSTSSGLGLGLPGSRRLMDDFEVESQVGDGTTVTMWKWLPASA